jgi:hypothetical protein
VANCISFSDFANMTWSSANINVFKVHFLNLKCVTNWLCYSFTAVSRYILNRAGESGNPCLTPWLVT